MFTSISKCERILKLPIPIVSCEPKFLILSRLIYGTTVKATHNFVYDPRELYKTARLTTGKQRIGCGQLSPALALRKKNISFPTRLPVITIPSHNCIHSVSNQHRHDFLMLRISRYKHPGEKDKKDAVAKSCTPIKNWSEYFVCRKSIRGPGAIRVARKLGEYFLWMKFPGIRPGTSSKRNAIPELQSWSQTLQKCTVDVHFDIFVSTANWQIYMYRCIREAYRLHKTFLVRAETRDAEIIFILRTTDSSSFVVPFFRKEKYLASISMEGIRGDADQRPSWI